MYVNIGNRQLNQNAIVGVEGCLPGQTGKVRIFVDPIAGSFLASSPELHFIAAANQQSTAIVELTGEQAQTFRMEWQQTASMGSGAGARG